MNLHIADNNTDYPHDNPNHDPLHKVRAFIQMYERTFQLICKPGCDLSYDNVCCPFKGRVQFHIYNANKEAKFHLKLFQIHETSWLHMCIWYLYWKGPDLMYTNCTSSGSKLYNNNTFCGVYGFSTPFGQTLWRTFFHSMYACGTSALK